MNASLLFQNTISFGENLSMVVRQGASPTILTTNLRFHRIRLGRSVTTGLLVDTSKLSDAEIERRGLEVLGEAVLIVGEEHQPLEPSSLAWCCGDEEDRI